MRRFFSTSLLAAFVFAGSLNALAQSDHLNHFPEILAGQTVSGVIPADDIYFNWAGPFEVYRFVADADARYRVTLSSEDIYSRISILSSIKGITDILNVGEGDYNDVNEAFTATLLFRPPTSGTYLIVPQTYDAEGGVYQLSVEVLPPPPPISVVPVSVGTVLNGMLNENSSIHINDWDAEIRHDLYSVELAPEQKIQIHMDSEDFDSYLEFGPIHGSDLEVSHEDDDSGGYLNALLIVDGGFNGGTFGIRARSYGAAEQGSYTLTIEDYVPAPVISNQISIGQTIESTLTSDDGFSPRGARAQAWTFSGNEGDVVIIHHMSDDFDAFLYVGSGLGDDFNELAYNDDGGGNLNALLEFVLPYSGEFTIIATAFGSYAEGTYTLSLELAD